MDNLFGYLVGLALLFAVVGGGLYLTDQPPSDPHAAAIHACKAACGTESAPGCAPNPPLSRVERVDPDGTCTCRPLTGKDGTKR